MLVNVFHDSPGEHRRLQLAGVALIVSMALLVYLSIAIYNKKFTDSTDITVKADRAGLQLAEVRGRPAARCSGGSCREDRQ